MYWKRGLCNYCEKATEDNSTICDPCYESKVKPMIGKSYEPVMIETVHVKGYGNVSVKRIDEVKRRAILPYAKPGGGYYVGRRSDSGKIEEKHPNY